MAGLGPTLCLMIFQWKNREKWRKPLYVFKLISRAPWHLATFGSPTHSLFQIGQLDNFIHRLWKYDLKPGFELMGNPGQFFKSNFTGTVIYNYNWYLGIFYISGNYIVRLFRAFHYLFEKNNQNLDIYYRSGRKQNMARQYHLPYKILHQKIWYQRSFSMEFWNVEWTRS